MSRAPVPLMRPPVAHWVTTTKRRASGGLDVSWSKARFKKERKPLTCENVDSEVPLLT